MLKDRFISENGRVISDVLEKANKLALGFLVTVDIEKACDSANHCFLLQILRKLRFGIDFVSLNKTISKIQEFCIIKRRKKIFEIRKKYSTRRSDICVFFYTCFRNIFYIC